MDPKRAKEAFDLMVQANQIIKTEWDRNTRDYGAFACYKANNAVIHMLGEAAEPLSGQRENYYPISRLVEALCLTSDHYQVPVGRAASLVSMMVKRS
jgi:hypothetical protein